MADQEERSDPRSPPSGKRAEARPRRPVPPHALCVASGKGGVGKTAVSAALAQLFARLGPVLLVDGDLGVGNAHILQDVQPEAHLGDVAAGRRTVREALCAVGPNLDLLAAGTGLPHMAQLTNEERQWIALGLLDVEPEYRTVLVDLGAGLSEQSLDLAQACDGVLLVTTPDVTALTDAYALFKVLLARNPNVRVWLLVNRAADEVEALRVAARFAEVSQRFLGASAELLCWVPEDPAVRSAVNRRRSVLRADPMSPASRALARGFARLERELAEVPPGGLGAGLSALAQRPRRVGA